MSAAEQTADIRALTAALEDAKRALKQARDAQQDFAVSGEKNSAKALELRAALLAQTREVERSKAALDEAVAAQREAVSAASELAVKQTKVKDLFGKAFSEELPEKARNAAEGFRLFGDSTLTAGERSKALFAGLSIGKNVLASYAGGAMSAASAVVALSEAVSQQRIAAEAASQRQRELGAAMARVAQVTGGSATATQAYAARTALLDAGLRANEETVARLTEAARRHRRANEDVEQSLSRVMSAVSGNAAAQRELGVRLSDTGTAQERLAQATAAFASENARLGPAVRTAADEQRAANESWEQGRSALLSFLGEVTLVTQATDAVRGLGRATQWVTEQMRPAATEAERQANALDSARAHAEKHTESLEKSRTTHARTKEDIQRVNQVLHAQREAANAAAQAQKQFAASLREVNFSAQATAGLTHQEVVLRNVTAAARQYNRELQEAATRRDARSQLMAADSRISRGTANRLLGIQESAGQDPSQRYDLADSINALIMQMRFGDARLGGSDRRADYRMSARELADLLAQLRGTVTGFGGGTLQRRPGEDAIAYQQRLAALAQQDVTAIGERRAGKTNAQYEADAAAARVQRERELARRSMQLGNEFTDEGLRGKAAESQQLAADDARARNFGAQLRDQFTSTATVAQRSATDVKGAFDMMTGALSTHLDALISGREAAGQAFLGMAADATKALALQSLQKGLFYTAEGVAYAATAPPLAPPMFAAAGIHFGIAAGAGLAAFGLGQAQQAQAGAQASPSASTPSSLPARGSEPGSDRGGASTVVYNFNGLISTRDAADQIARIQSEGSRRGVRSIDVERRR